MDRMKAGDVVKFREGGFFQHSQGVMAGIVVKIMKIPVVHTEEFGTAVAKILWQDGAVSTEMVRDLDCISESR